jgi:hypothetical protein
VFVKVLVNLSGENSKWLRSSRMLGVAIRPVLEALVQIDQLYLRFHHNVPPLYQSGVRYKEEPVNVAQLGGGPLQRIEEFACIPAILERGWDDCDGLAPWRCAELREAGEPAKIRIQWRKNPASGQKLFHIVVRRADHSIEDPSALLGMR